MKINIKEKIIFVLCYLFALILLFKDGLRKGMFLSGYDIDTLSLPFRIFAKSTFDTYKSMPVWLPGILNGIPLIDSSNIEYFYPLNFIYMMLPIHPAYTYTFDIIIHLFIAGTGTYCFLSALRLHPFSCFFGGFIFMTSCMLVFFVNSGIMGIIKAVSFIPFVFYFIKRGIDGGRFISFLNISVLFAMQILCLGIQITFYTILAGGIYFIFELIQENSKKRSDKIIYFVAACCLTIFLGALQLFPTAEYFRYSWRSGADIRIFNYGFFEPIKSVSFFCAYQ
ncbi:MAG: hypothetical protein KA120_01065 [Candidatus Goldbacteria bacterium]|nr:hypothetical protein [Candidatus Goldiibacteriota bacterium]